MSRDATGERDAEAEAAGRTTVDVSDTDTTVIVRTVTRIVVPLILLTAVALLLRGHNLPGGGFIAGVLTAAAVALVYVIYGLEFFDEEVLHRYPDRESIPEDLPATADVPPEEPEGDPTEDLAPAIVADYTTLFGLGLALAAGSGLVAMFFGLPFLSQAIVFLEGLPIYHELELASALAFDLGVYLVVVGALLSILAVVGSE